MNMPSSQNRSNCAFRCSFLRLATIPTAKSGLKNGKTESSKIFVLKINMLYNPPPVDAGGVLLEIIDNYCSHLRLFEGKNQGFPYFFLVRFMYSMW
jgi:hypothetical protein